MTDKTSIFIRKAREVHGNLYDYSKVLYVHSRLKIIIICKEHGEFEQLSSFHIRGHGCSKCSRLNNGINSRQTTNEFIEQVQKIHGERYDYSKVFYIKSNLKVIIICREHGEFLQSPAIHKVGGGCSKCANTINKIKTRYSTKEYIENVKNKFGDRYDYSKVEYINSRSNITIICKEHGEFLQNAYAHSKYGRGCIKCVERIRCRDFSTEKYIEKAKIIHGDKYDYSKVNYIHSELKVIIICKEHGEFLQRATHHINSNQECPKCQIKKKYSKPSIDWLNFIQLKDNIDIQHAGNIGEYKIPNTRFSADGFFKEKNIIYEFYGDYWHGNPNIYCGNRINQSTNCTFGELYQRTIDREQQIRDLGYNLITIWENDWNKLNRCVKILQRKYRKSKLR